MKTQAEIKSAIEACGRVGTKALGSTDVASAATMIGCQMALEWALEMDANGSEMVDAVVSCQLAAPPDRN